MPNTSKSSIKPQERTITFEPTEYGVTEKILDELDIDIHKRLIDNIIEDLALKLATKLDKQTIKDIVDGKI